MTARLHRYWIQFEQQDHPTWTNLGCGVTAWTTEDALVLLRDGPFRAQQMPEIKAIAVDVDVSTLDAGHILPNMEAPNRRGVWFPRGYSPT